MAQLCANCGAECEEAARFCSNCGALLQRVGAEMEDFIRDFRKRLEGNPEDLDARFNLALAYKHAGRLDLACDELERARAQHADSLDVLLELGKLYRRLKQKDKAIAAAEAILALAPDHQGAARLLRRLKED